MRQPAVTIDGVQQNCYRRTHLLLLLGVTNYQFEHSYYTLRTTQHYTQYEPDCYICMCIPATVAGGNQLPATTHYGQHNIIHNMNQTVTYVCA